MTIIDRTTGQRYQLVKRTNTKSGRYLNARTGQRYDLVKVYI